MLKSSMKRLQNEMTTTTGRSRLYSAYPIKIIRSNELLALCSFLSLSYTESISNRLSLACRLPFSTAFSSFNAFFNPREYLTTISLVNRNSTSANLMIYLEQAQYSIYLLQFLEQQSVFRKGSIMQKKVGAMSSIERRQKKRKLWVQERASSSLGGFFMQTRKLIMWSVAR